MTREVLVLREEDNLSHVLEVMGEMNVRHLPVVDDGRLIGMVSQRDVLRLTRADLVGTAVSRDAVSRASERTFIADVMTRDVVAVSPETSVARAARLLAQHRFGCLPVVDTDDALVGIVSETDFLRHLVGLALTERQSRGTPIPPLEPVPNP